jgi:sugar diacid utilization regulator
MDDTSAPTAEQSESALRDQLTSLLSLLALSMRMTESRSEGQILKFATASVPSLVDCRMLGVVLDPARWLLTVGPLAQSEARADLIAQFAVLNDAGGAVSIADEPWSWAFPLRSLTGQLGLLVVGADEEPSALDRFVLRVLAQQIGIALSNVQQHDRELAASAELRAANARLANSVEAIRRRAEIHERLTQAAMTGAGLAGIASAVHDLSGHAIVIEDRTGNVIARAGGGDDDLPARPSRSAHERMARRLLEAGGPVREADRIAVIIGPLENPAGVIFLADPDGTAGEPEIVALEHGATVAAMELSRLQSLGETQFQLARDLVDDLLTGVDPQVAIERGRAIGCDLLQPRRVVVVARDGNPTDVDDLLGSIRRAFRDRLGWLFSTRGGAVVVLADGDADWDAFRAAADRLAHGGLRIGVGGPAAAPQDVARSHREARLALKMGGLASSVGSVTEAGTVTVFDDLGVFRLFAEVEEIDSVERFVSDWLGPLLEYDARKPAELVPTLSQFLEAGQAYEATSAALTIHRSTLKYRLQRIREISGHDLSKPDIRFNLQLATRAWQTLAALRDAPGDAVRSAAPQGRPAAGSAGSPGQARPSAASGASGAGRRASHRRTAGGRTGTAPSAGSARHSG